ncbi:hypothetical protein SLA2020_331080 [Shorea laevis]
MANIKMAMCLTMVVAAMLCAEAAAQSGCTAVLISLSPCLNYITGNSSTPSSQCCSQLASVVRSSAQCLCQVLNGGASSLGININQTQAMALPGACNVQTPPISQCNATSPAASPAGSPEASTAFPSGSGSKTAPLTKEDGSFITEGKSTKLSSSLLIFFLLAASYSSIFTTY